MTAKTTVRDVLGPSFPIIVTLCGSTRFREMFHEAFLRETLGGKIVLAPGCVHADEANLHPPYPVLRAMRNLHERRIDLSDEVLVLNVDGYLGESTSDQLAYVLARGKRVRTLEPLDLAAWQAARGAPAGNK